MKKTSYARRDFIRNGFLAGAGACMLPACEDSDQNSNDKVRLLTPEGKVVEVDRAALKPAPDMKMIPYSVRKGIPGKRFIMVIDLSRCKNARKCQSACNKMHHIPENQEWLKVYRMHDSEDTSPYWQPTVCLHCEEPPCVKVCPVDATFKRQDGIVLIDNKRCIGCRFCMAACPYSARVFNWGKPSPEHELHSHYSPEKGYPAQMGTVEKCDFCPDEIIEGKLPHCVNACPNGVFFFGDLNEDTVTNGSETFRFSQLIKDKAGYRLMEELGTEPNVYYLPPANRLFPFEEGLEEENT